MVTVVAALVLLILSIFDVKGRAVPAVVLAAGGLAALGCRIAEGLIGMTAPRELFAKILLGLIPGAVMLLISALTGKLGRADGEVILIVGVLYG